MDHHTFATPRTFQTIQRVCTRHCPTERETNTFYLAPLKNPKADVWYSKTAVGHNTLDKTVKHLCAVAGIKGLKTNHSLCTAATRLSQNGVDGRLIMC